ncbi:hypothetical protein FOA52_005440 [Chlamydomonas sp. UWO 241]|nr:hypothetical protein FOA52_005440 [Chlamydomonas sp. UWO 241]
MASVDMELLDLEFLTLQATWSDLERGDSDGDQHTEVAATRQTPVASKPRSRPPSPEPLDLVARTLLVVFEGIIQQQQQLKEDAERSSTHGGGENSRNLSELTRKLDRFKHARSTVLRALQDVDTYQLSTTTTPSAGYVISTHLHGLTELLAQDVHALSNDSRAAIAVAAAAAADAGSKAGRDQVHGRADGLLVHQQQQQQGSGWVRGLREADGWTAAAEPRPVPRAASAATDSAAASSSSGASPAASAATGRSATTVSMAVAQPTRQQQQVQSQQAHKMEPRPPPPSPEQMQPPPPRRQQQQQAVAPPASDRQQQQQAWEWRAHAASVGGAAHARGAVGTPVGGWQPVRPVAPAMPLTSGANAGGFHNHYQHSSSSHASQHQHYHSQLDVEHHHHRQQRQQSADSAYAPAGRTLLPEQHAEAGGAAWCVAHAHMPNTAVAASAAHWSSSVAAAGRLISSVSAGGAGLSAQEEQQQQQVQQAVWQEPQTRLPQQQQQEQQEQQQQARSRPSDVTRERLSAQEEQQQQQVQQAAWQEPQTRLPQQQQEQQQQQAQSWPSNVTREGLSAQERQQQAQQAAWQEPQTRLQTSAVTHAANPIKRDNLVVKVYQQMQLRRRGDSGAGGGGGGGAQTRGASSGGPADSARMLEEMAARSGYQQQICADLEAHGDHFRTLGQHLFRVELGTTDALVAFVDKVEADILDRLSESDDQKVLAQLEWPFPRYEAMREAVILTREISTLRDTARAWAVDPSRALRTELTHITEFYARLAKRCEQLVAGGEATAKRFKEHRLPWDISAVQRVKTDSLRLMLVYITALIPHLDSELDDVDAAVCALEGPGAAQLGADPGAGESSGGGGASGASASGGGRGESSGDGGGGASISGGGGAGAGGGGGAEPRPEQPSTPPAGGARGAATAGAARSAGRPPARRGPPPLKKALGGVCATLDRAEEFCFKVHSFVGGYSDEARAAFAHVNARREQYTQVAKKADAAVAAQAAGAAQLPSPAVALA